MAGSIALLVATDQQTTLIVGGACLFGIGNATSLPPLIAQAESVKDDNARVVPLIVAISRLVCLRPPANFAVLPTSDGAAHPHFGAGTQAYFLAALGI